MIATTLETVFNRIAATRMAGLPILNPALEVEAVGFRDWQGETYGILITPWFMNLLCLPGEDSAWPRMQAGSTHNRCLPGGEFAFLAAEEADIGPYLSCSLFSPMADFADMDGARAVALEAVTQLFRPDEPEVPAGLSARLERPISRRGFLSALLPGERQP